MNSTTSRTIRAVLEKNGFEVYSVRKKKRMVGGQRYNFHGGLRQGNCPGRPQYFYEICMDGDLETEDLAAVYLRDSGYKNVTSSFAERLRIYI